MPSHWQTVNLYQGNIKQAVPILYYSSTCHSYNRAKYCFFRFVQQAGTRPNITESTCTYWNRRVGDFFHLVRFKRKQKRDKTNWLIFTVHASIRKDFGLGTYQNGKNFIIPWYQLGNIEHCSRNCRNISVVHQRKTCFFATQLTLE